MLKITEWFAVLLLLISTSLCESYVLHTDSLTIRTPNYPRQYPPDQDISWTILLQPFEKISFGMNFRDILLSRFDCPKLGQGDFFEYYVNGTLDKRITANDDFYLLRVPVTESVTNITIRFVSDDEWAGCGLSIHYKIICEDSRWACLNSGVCRLGRTVRETKPIQCLCPDGFTGAKCGSRAIESLCHPGCMSGERCVVDSSTKKAVCESQMTGWRHVPAQGMVDIDECEESKASNNISICQGNLTCYNTPGSYYCGCDTEAGYVAKTDKNGSKYCEQGCANPWVMFNDDCYLFPDDLMANAAAARKWCKEAGGHLTSVKSIEENAFLGKKAKSALTWFDLSDVEGERNFVSATSDAPRPNDKAMFSNWGPGFPDGSGDYAILYPNRWVKGPCADKKRFLCQAKAPYCPGNWFQPEDSDHCYYQSTYDADHLGANRACKYLAIGGRLAPWTPFEAIRLGPSFWETSATDEGPAHFWVGIVADKHSELAMYTMTNMSKELPPGITYEGSALSTDDVVDDLDEEPHLNATSRYQLTAEDGAQIEISLAFACGYLYPNKWADYTYNSATASDARPGFVCRKAIDDDEM